jgi:pyruvate/2-oxoglutarate dehydrogenase complex dihydrolipoamide acyltransferase (E2) component
MAEVVAVRIPQDNVNDDAVLLLAWLVQDGANVAADQPLIEVETSKATMDITSPAAGVIQIVVPGETEIPVGNVLCYIGDSLEAIQAFRSSGQIAVAPSHTESLCPEEAQCAVDQKDKAATQPCTEQDSECPSAGSTRFSHAALELIREHGLCEADFSGRGLIRTKEVLARLFPNAATVVPHATRPEPMAPSEPAQAIRGAAGVAIRSEAQSRTKRLETKLLSWSSRHTLRSSVVTTLTTTTPLPVRKTDPDAAERLSAALIHECGQLLKQFPAFNAYCDRDQVHFYERVHIGYALDAGKGLKVPVLQDADTKSLDELLEERRRFVAEYLIDKLRPESLASGTFTISDLSGSGVFLFDPLIVEAQSAILGVGADFAPPGSSFVAYNLVLSFDHRLIEGRLAARFVNELKERMLAHEEGPPAPHSTSAGAHESCCSRCGMTFREAAGRKHFLVQVATAADTRPDWVCTICLQGR